MDSTKSANEEIMQRKASIQTNLDAMQAQIQILKTVTDKLPDHKLGLNLKRFEDLADNFKKLLATKNDEAFVKKAEDYYEKVVNAYQELQIAIFVAEAKYIIPSAKTTATILMSYADRSVETADEKTREENAVDRASLNEFISNYTAYESEMQKAKPDLDELLEYRNKLFEMLNSLEAIEVRSHAYAEEQQKLQSTKPQDNLGDEAARKISLGTSKTQKNVETPVPAQDNHSRRSSTSHLGVFGPGSKSSNDSSKIADQEIKDKMHYFYQIMVTHSDHWKKFKVPGFSSVREIQRILSEVPGKENNPEALRSIWSKLTQAVKGKNPIFSELKSLYKDIQDGSAKDFRERLAKMAPSEPSVVSQKRPS